MNIKSAFTIFKEAFMEFISNEFLTAKGERKELLLVVKSELNSIVWEQRLLKMQENKYQIFNEFVAQAKFQNVFTAEKKLVKYLQKANNEMLILKITRGFQKIFENTNSAKYTNVDKWFEMFSTNLIDEFPKYSYIAWERILLTLEKERLTSFPCLNEILQRIEDMNTDMIVKQVNFLKKIKLID